LKKQPAEFYFFLIVFIALLAAIAMMCWNNIIPYYNLVKTWFFVGGEEPLYVFDFFQYRIQLTLSWLAGMILWAVLQGCQIAYLLYTFSERALDFVINQDNSTQKYHISDRDSRLVKRAKKTRNELPMASLMWLQLFCLGAYGIETAINYETYPFLAGGLSTIGKIVTFNYDFKEVFLYFLTIFAVESLVFAAIIFYKILEVFYRSGAYKS